MCSEKIDLMSRIPDGHTPRPWYPGHFVDAATLCNCTAIVDEGYAGGIAQVFIGNGLPICDGGNDAPPLDEARDNARLIALAPELADEVRRLSAENDRLRVSLMRAASGLGLLTTHDGVELMRCAVLAALLEIKFSLKGQAHD